MPAQTTPPPAPPPPRPLHAIAAAARALAADYTAKADNIMHGDGAYGGRLVDELTAALVDLATELDRYQAAAPTTYDALAAALGLVEHRADDDPEVGTPFPIVDVDPAEIADEVEAFARGSARLREDEERAADASLATAGPPHPDAAARAQAAAEQLPTVGRWPGNEAGR